MYTFLGAYGPFLGGNKNVGVDDAIVYFTIQTSGKIQGITLCMSLLDKRSDCSSGKVTGIASCLSSILPYCLMTTQRLTTAQSFRHYSIAAAFEAKRFRTDLRRLPLLFIVHAVLGRPDAVGNIVHDSHEAFQRFCEYSIGRIAITSYNE